MDDYRNEPLESPLVWCLHCEKLLPRHRVAKVMVTIFRVSESGVYPFGVCDLHALDEPLQQGQQERHD